MQTSLGLATLRSAIHAFKFTPRQLFNRQAPPRLQPMSQSAALIFSAVIAMLGVFQLALAAGAPWGRLAWGGGHDRLPPALRIGSLLSVAIYAIFATIVLERAGVIRILPSPEIAHIGTWVIAGYLALGVVMNAISRSKPERLVMTPVALVLCVAAGLVALM
jgi:hypothetical protein